MIFENADTLERYWEIKLLTPDHDQHSENSLAVAFCLDSKFLPHAGVCILSIIENHPDALLEFYIISSEDLSSSYEKLVSLVANTPHRLNICTLHADFFSALPCSDVFPAAIYYRLLLPYILVEKKYVLYLDSDIVCLRPFANELLQKDTNDCPAYAVKEPLSLSVQLSDKIGLDEAGYFNSGVIFINTSLWREKNVSAHTLELLSKRGKDFLYPDQDALNIILKSEIGYLPAKFNHILKLNSNKNNIHRQLPNDTVFVHYTGSEKPWKVWNDHLACRAYRRNYRISPWAGLPFEYPKDNQDAKKMYKYCLRNSMFFLYIKWYAQYLYMRYFLKV